MSLKSYLIISHDNRWELRNMNYVLVLKQLGNVEAVFHHIYRYLVTPDVYLYDPAQIEWGFIRAYIAITGHLDSLMIIPAVAPGMCYRQSRDTTKQCIKTNSKRKPLQTKDHIVMYEWIVFFCFDFDKLIWLINPYYAPHFLGTNVVINTSATNISF